MELTEISGQDLELEATETMLQALPAAFSGLFRIGELGVFDAVALAERGGVALSPEVQLLAADNVFTVVRIPVSIRPPERSRVRYLAVEIALNSSDGSAIGWSMDPVSVSDEVTVSTTLGLSAGLTVSVVEVGPEAQRSQEYTVRQPRITAFNLGNSDPVWEFQPTKAGALAGVQLLHLVVKAPLEGRWSGDVSIRADVTYRQLLWNTRAIKRDGNVCVASFARP